MKWLGAFLFAAFAVAPQISYSQVLVSSISLKPQYMPPIDRLDNVADSLDNLVARTTQLSNEVTVDSLDNMVGWLTNLMFRINGYENRAAIERYKGGVLDRINADQQKINRAALTALFNRVLRSQIIRTEKSSTPGAFNLNYSLRDESGAALAANNILTQTGVTVSWQTSNAACASFALPGGSTSTQATGLKAVTTPVKCAASITAALVRPPGMTAALASLPATLELKNQ